MQPRAQPHQRRVRHHEARRGLGRIGSAGCRPGVDRFTNDELEKLLHGEDVPADGLCDPTTSRNPRTTGNRAGRPDRPRPHRLLCATAPTDGRRATPRKRDGPSGQHGPAVQRSSGAAIQQCNRIQHCSRSPCVHEGERPSKQLTACTTGTGSRAHPGKSKPTGKMRRRIARSRTTSSRRGVRAAAPAWFQECG